MHCVTLIPGDGIGPKITQSARDIVTASGADVAWELASAGMNAGADSSRFHVLGDADHGAS